MPQENLISHIMVPAPATIRVNQPLTDVRSALATECFHHLPVVSDERLVGLISSNDLLRLGLGDNINDVHPAIDSGLCAADIMRTDVISVGQRATIREAATLLSAGGFHALPVVNDDMHVTGLITSTDLIMCLLESPPTPAASPEILQRLEQLENIRQAAEHYLHSGQGITEHSRLQKAIDNLGKKVVL